MKLIINGNHIEAQEGDSVLEAALASGIYIPHLCKHPDLEAVGGCRLCSVEIEGAQEAVPSCMTTVSEGMVVRTDSEKANATRKAAMELILASHPADCTGCPKYGKCELQSLYQYMGVSPEKWRKKSRTFANDDSNPLISHLFTRCIRCGRCIRACRELRGVKVLDFQKTKDGVRAGIEEGKTLKEAGCQFCGACIEVCPTGSIMDAVGIIRENVSYSDSVVPCRSACPASIDIPRYVRYIKKGDFSKAAAVAREKVPFPEILGNICNHACEDACKRNELNKPVSVCRLKRAAAANDDLSWKAKSLRSESTGKKAAVIGAGPAGLTAAYYLAKKGHSVTVYEENEKAGGQCRYGIPAYRLPDEVIDREIAHILDSGVEIMTLSKRISPEELLGQGCDAVIVAAGTHRGTKLPIPGNDLNGVYVNADFLKRARQNDPLPVGERVVVLGGGNVAYDCARTALRLGAKEVHIACLENLNQMTATEDEIREGGEEGIILHSAHSFLRITGEEKAEGVELQKVDKFYFDENRKAVIELVEGTNEIIPADNVIFAVGQKPGGTENMGLELVNNAYVKADENLKTSMEGVYAAGDVVTGTKTVIAAIASGRKAAAEVDKYLEGDGDISEELVEKEVAEPFIGRTQCFVDFQRIMPHMADADKRRQDFSIVEEQFSVQQAISEAERCLQCDLRLQITRPKLWNEY